MSKRIEIFIAMVILLTLSCIHLNVFAAETVIILATGIRDIPWWNLIVRLFFSFPWWAKLIIILMVIGLISKISEVLSYPFRKMKKHKKDLQEAQNELEDQRAKYGSDDKIRIIKEMQNKIRSLNEKELILIIGLGGKDNIREFKAEQKIINVVVWNVEKVRIEYIEAVYKVASIEYGIVKMKVPYGEEPAKEINLLKEFMVEQESNIVSLEGADL